MVGDCLAALVSVPGAQSHAQPRFDLSPAPPGSAGRDLFADAAKPFADLLAALARGFGAIAVQPVHPLPNTPAIRVLVRAVKGSRAPLAILSGLVLAAHDGTPTPAAEAVLRRGEALTILAER